MEFITNAENTLTYMITETTLPVLLIGLAGLCVVLYIVYSIVESIVFNKKIKKYMEAFEYQYEESNNIKKTLQAVKGEYKETSKPARTLAKSLYYLDHSILRDYKGALDIATKECFNSVKVREMHSKYLDMEKNRLYIAQKPQKEEKPKEEQKEEQTNE